MKLARFAGNPILSPHPDHDWEDLAVFNPAAWYDQQAGEVLLLYRAAESGPEYKCYFGLAKSSDGLHFARVSDRPVLSPSVDAFVAPNVLKWHWWRFNGFGFFAGMVAGTATAMALPPRFPWPEHHAERETTEEPDPKPGSPARNSARGGAGRKRGSPVIHASTRAAGCRPMAERLKN